MNEDTKNLRNAGLLALILGWVWRKLQRDYEEDGTPRRLRDRSWILSGILCFCLVAFIGGLFQIGEHIGTMFWILYGSYWTVLLLENRKRRRILAQRAS